MFQLCLFRQESSVTVTMTVSCRNWETTEPICTQPQAGQDVFSLVFNPLNWLQLCALGSTSLTVWNIEKSASFHVLKPR